MDSRTALYAQVFTQLHASRRRFGWSALGLFALAALLGSGAEATIDKLAAWLFGFAAFYCFARYGGDSKDMERLEQWRNAPPPSLPLAPLTRDDEALINAYGRILLRFSGEALIPISKLPSPKRQLKRVLAAGIQQTNIPENRLILEEGYLNLSRFQPFLNNSPTLPIAASADEYLCLTHELAALRR